MGYYQEAAIARALEVAAERAKRQRLGRVQSCTDAQAAITRMTHDEPGPGQTYVLQARKAIAALRERSAGAQHTRAFPATRLRTAGLSRLPASRMGCSTPINMDVGPCRRPPWPT